MRQRYLKVAEEQTPKRGQFAKCFRPGIGSGKEVQRVRKRDAFVAVVSSSLNSQTFAMLQSRITVCGEMCRT